MSGIRLGAAPRFQFPAALAVDGDALIIIDTDAVLALRHAVR